MNVHDSQVDPRVHESVHPNGLQRQSKPFSKPFARVKPSKLVAVDVHKIAWVLASKLAHVEMELDSFLRFRGGLRSLFLKFKGGSSVFVFEIQRGSYRPANSPGVPGSLQIFHQIFRELPTVALFNFFSSISLFSRRRERSEGLRMIFGEYSDIAENYILTMQRFRTVSRFLYSVGWQVWS